MWPTSVSKKLKPIITIFIKVEIVNGAIVGLVIMIKC